jgi:hypothetical protein
MGQMRLAMRYIVVLVVAALLSAGCGADQPPPVPASGSGAPSTPPEPGRAIPAPADADLHGAPAPDAEDLRELYDISRDLHAVALGERGAVDDLAQDLSRFAAPSGGDARTIAESVGRALQGRTLDETNGRRLAVLLYVAMRQGDLTPAQRSGASAALRDLLTTAGAPAAQAGEAAGQIR